MFQLTIIRESTELTCSYSQARVVAGPPDAHSVDLPLFGQGIVPAHFAIFPLQGAYYIENIANDPQLRVNGAPFWRRRLCSGDKIHVGENILIFKQLESPKEAEQPPAPSAKEPHTVEEIQQITETLPMEAAPQEKRLSKFFKELGTRLIEKLQAKRGESKWHVFALFFGCASALLGLFCLVFYVSVAQKSEQQRLIAARGLADIAVTLNYAKMHRIKPSNLNWIDPDFLAETSKHVIPDPLTSRSWILEGGDFAETPYLLRIYSDPQLDRFLLIAQPKANFVQWLIPNSTVVVDSNTMVMREIPHLKELNRLLVNASGFEGQNQKDILRLIERQKPLSLRTLAKNRQGLGFMPPEELRLIGEDLELYLYNAPRYYLWNMMLVEKAHKLGEPSKDPQEAEMIAKSLERRKAYTGMVLYTPDGVETAIDARRAIGELAPESPLHIGYLTLSKNGQIDTSHVLIKSQKPWAIDTTARNMIEERSLPHLPKEIAELTKNPLYPFTAPRNEISKTVRENIPLHPLLIELSLLLEERESAIRPHLEPLVNLLTEHARQSDRQFFIRYKNLFTNYENALRTQQEALDLKVDALHEKYVIKNRTVTLPQFLAFLDQKGIDMGYEEDSFLLSKASSEEQLRTLFALIEETHNIHVLDQAVREAHDLITSDKQRAQLRSAVLHKLERMLWKPNVQEGELPGGEELRWIVGRILKNGYITQRDAKEFYLSNFLE